MSDAVTVPCLIDEVSLSTSSHCAKICLRLIVPPIRPDNAGGRQVAGLQGFAPGNDMRARDRAQFRRRTEPGED